MNRRVAKTAAIKSGVVRTASTKAATPVGNTAAEAAVHAAEAASAVTLRNMINPSSKKMAP
jgi:hypothetical protein